MRIRAQLAELPAEPAADTRDNEPPAKVRRVDEYDDEVDVTPAADEVTAVVEGKPAAVPWVSPVSEAPSVHTSLQCPIRAEL